MRAIGLRISRNVSSSDGDLNATRPRVDGSSSMSQIVIGTIFFLPRLLSASPMRAI